MSYGATGYRSSVQICQWCSQQTSDIRQIKNCPHVICNKCIFIDKKCQSDCPWCWYINAGQFIHNNKICAVCCSGINPDDQTFVCSQQHQHCSQCPSLGCILCQFRQLNSWNNSSYRNLPTNSQHILYACHTWQIKFEENQQSILNNSTIIQSNGQYNSKASSLLQVDNESQLVSGLSQSKDNRTDPTKNNESDDCIICLERLGLSYHRLEVCGHCFHKSCIDTWFQSSGKQSCPSCGYVYGINKGPQPPNGEMTIKSIPTPLPGFEKERYGYHEAPTIEITYSFPSGIQGPLNPNPGKPFTGTTRKAYLPNNKEGKEILELLRKAFNDQHIFTIGRSATTGQDNVVTWNDIHHKTSMTGGPDRFGYPDPTYLYRIRQELADKGYK